MDGSREANKPGWLWLGPAPQGATPGCTVAGVAASLPAALEALDARRWEGLAVACAHLALASTAAAEVRLRHPMLSIALHGPSPGPVLAAMAATGADPRLVHPGRGGPPLDPGHSRAALHAMLDEALARSWLHPSPIAARPGARPWAWQTTLRTPVTGLRREPALRHLASVLGRGHLVDQHLRRLAVAMLERAGPGVPLVVDLDTDEVERGPLGTGADPLDPYAPWVVLGFARRRFDTAAGDLPARRLALETAGYRVVVGGRWDPPDTLVAMRGLRPDAYRVHAPREPAHGAAPHLRQIAQVVTLAQREGAQVVATGVEGLEQLHTMRAAGCTLFHGRAAGRAGPAWNKA